MPFLIAKVDSSAFEKEKNLVKRLIRNFGTSGGGIFTKNVELQLLECKNNGEVYFRLLEYLEAAVNKVILGQTASSGDSSGLSKGDAQSKVRQDILESDCRIIQHVINAQLLKPWTLYNYGPEDVVALIHHAEYVFTDSFHAVVFSTIYNKKFFAFDRDERNSTYSINARIRIAKPLCRKRNNSVRRRG